MDIHTKLYTDKAFNILDSVIGQLSDGKWEDSPSMNGYWMFANINRNCDGEVVISISEKGYDRGNCNKFLGKPETEIKKMFARWIKAVAKDNIEYEHLEPWKRTSVNSKLHYLDRYDPKVGDYTVTVADAYVVYEQLLGREIGVNKYDAATISGVFGNPRPEAEIKKAIAIASEKSNAETLKQSQILKIREEYEQKIAKLRDEQRIAEDLCRKAYADKLLEIEKKYA